MPTNTEVHSAINQLTAAVFDSTPVVYGNMDETEALASNSSWVKQNVFFTSNSQFQLGDTEKGKNRGILLFLIHVRKGTGDGERNTLMNKVVQSFRSKVVGGATLLNARMIAQRANERWSLTAVEIPFYFYD